MTTHPTDTKTQMANKLKIAFMGGSYRSAVGKVHRIAAEMDKRFELVAGCFSRDQDANHQTAMEYGVPVERTYLSLPDLISSEVENLDAVVVMTPQDQHHEHVTILLDSGVPVICEKALVASSTQAEDIRERVVRSGCFLAVTYNYTGFPMVRELRRMIRAGRLGKIQQVLLEMPQEGFARVSPAGLPVVPQEWRLRDGKVVPTLSLDLGVHLHMMARFLTGERPEEVVAMSSSRGNFSEVIDTVHCLARLSGGVDCNIWYGKTAFGYRNGLKIRVFGDLGSAEWVQENPETLLFADNSGGRFILDRTSKEVEVACQLRYQRFKAGHPAGFIEAFANYYYDIADALTHRRDPDVVASSEYVFGVEESLEGLRMLEAIERSSHSQQWEKVN